MSFQFNFFSNEKNISEKEVKLEENDLKSISCEEWKVSTNFIEKEFESEVVEGFPELLKRKYSDILSEIKGKELGEITESSDVIPKQYEGGLKTWECSIDLLNFMMEHVDSIKSQVSAVLEVGCGSALPGIFCHKIISNPKLFVFQDFNQNVLESVTVPNVLLNLKPSSFENFKFFYGDWKNFPEKLPKKSFDLILTSETIYRSESYQMLLDIFLDSLSDKEGARVLLAAKDYYFGLGGSVQQFINFASLKGWNIRILRQFSEGIPRSILELKRK
jgi:protein-histidine N-methyltransferase